MASIAIEWHDAGDGSVCYRANDRELGSDSQGFGAVLALIRGDPDAEVILKCRGGTLGGEGLEATTPFADRFTELIEALGDRSLNWELL